MSPELQAFKPDSRRTLPRAAVALAAFSMLAAGCANGETGSASSTSTAQASETGTAHTPTASASAKPGENTGHTPQAPHESQSGSYVPKASKTPETTKAPASTPSSELAALIFKVTGSCHMDGELQNWSKNFTPYGSTHNKIVQPDGTLYEGPINEHVDGLGHSQWNVTCSDFAQEGDYTGTITDLGPDNVLGTADDRSVNYTFGISNS